MSAAVYKLWLHGAHSAGTGAPPEPLGMAEAAAVIFEASIAGHTDAGVPNDCLMVTLRGQNLVVHHPLFGECLEIPFLFAEVRLCKEMYTTTLPLITVTASERGKGWLVFVEGDESAGISLINIMGQLGAVRCDFDETYGISSKPLATGSSGVIYKVLRLGQRDSGSTDMVAKIPKQREVFAETVPMDVSAEVHMLMAVQGHPNVIGYYGLFISDTVSQYYLDDEGEPGCLSHWVIAVEECPGGDLFDAAARSVFSEARAIQTTKSLLSALIYIHSKGILHRDVKPENVLLRNDGEAVLGDFGLACHIEDREEMTRWCGSRGYTAPEIVRKNAYDTKADCFSLGSLVFFILSGRCAFHGPTPASTLRRTCRGQVDTGAAGFQHRSGACKDFVMELLRVDPSSRLSAEDALMTRWIEGLGDVQRGAANGSVERHQGQRPSWPLPTVGKYFRRKWNGLWSSKAATTSDSNSSAAPTSSHQIRLPDNTFNGVICQPTSSIGTSFRRRRPSGSAESSSIKPA